MGILSAFAFLINDLTSADFRRNSAAGEALSAFLALVDESTRSDFLRRMERLINEHNEDLQSHETITKNVGSPEYPYFLFLASVPADKKFLIKYAITLMPRANSTSNKMSKIKDIFVEYVR